MKKRGIISLVVASILTVSVLAGCQTQKKFPDRAINVTVFSTAGGGTDLTARALSAEMEKELGGKFNVSNMPGGSGGVGATYVSAKEPDGYNILGCSEGLFPLAVLNASETTSKDWEYFLFGGTPAVLSVREDSKYNTVEEVIADMKANPGKISLANSQVGCIWDIKAALLQEAAGIDYKFIPYQGSNPSILACLNGEVDVIITGVGEQSEFLAAKKLKPLALIELEDGNVPGYDNVPSIVKAVPAMKDKLPVDQVVGFAIPAAVPAETLKILTDAFVKAVDSDSVKEYAKTKHIVIKGLYGQEAKAYAQEMEKLFSWVLFDKGVATISPEKFGIERP